MLHIFISNLRGRKNLACCKAIMENDNKDISSNRRSPVMETSAMVEFGQTTLCRGSSEVLQLAELSTGKKRDTFPIAHACKPRDDSQVVF